MSALSKIEDLFAGGAKIALAFGSPLQVRLEGSIVENIIVQIFRDFYELTAEHTQLSVSTNTARNDEHALEADSSKVHFVLRSQEEQWKRPGKSLEQAFEKSKQIAFRHGAKLQLLSSRGSFQISLYLPVVAQKLESDNRAVGRPGSRKPEVLIIDDDPFVLDTTSEILQRNNIACATAQDASEALEQFRKHKDTLAAVVLDLLLPGAESSSLFEALRRIRKDMIFIGFSGASPEIKAHFRKQGLENIIHKPVEPEVLVREIQGLLQATARSQVA